MKMLVLQTVFNRELEGKAVRITGRDRNKDIWKGIYLVSKVDFDRIDLVNIEGHTYSLFEEDFKNKGCLEVIVLVEGEEVE